MIITSRKQKTLKEFRVFLWLKLDVLNQIIINNSKKYNNNA